MHAAHLKARPTLNNSRERSKVLCLQRQGRLVHAEIAPRKIRAQIAAQTLRVERDTSHGAEMHHIAAARKGAVNNAPATGATRDGKRVVGVRRRRDTIAAEAGDGIEDRGGRPLGCWGVEGPIPVGLSTGVVALGAKHGFVHGNHVPVPGEEVAGVVNREGLLNVGVDQIVVPGQDARIGKRGSNGGLGEEAINGGEV